jgi:hypothetical protein
MDEETGELILMRHRQLTLFIQMADEADDLIGRRLRSPNHDRA